MNTQETSLREKAYADLNNHQKHIELMESQPLEQITEKWDKPIKAGTLIGFKGIKGMGITAAYPVVRVEGSIITFVLFWKDGKRYIDTTSFSSKELFINTPPIIVTIEHPQEFPSLLESGEGKDFAQWLKEDGVPQLSAILLELKLANAQKENEKLKRLLESLTPSGSEFVNNPEGCAAWVKERIREIPSIIVPFKRESERLKALNGELIEILDKILCEYSDNEVMKSTPIAYFRHFDKAQTLLSKAKTQTT